MHVDAIILLFVVAAFPPPKAFDFDSVQYFRVGCPPLTRIPCASMLHHGLV